MLSGLLAPHSPPWADMQAALYETRIKDDSLRSATCLNSPRCGDIERGLCVLVRAGCRHRVERRLAWCRSDLIRKEFISDSVKRLTRSHVSLASPPTLFETLYSSFCNLLCSFRSACCLNWICVRDKWFLTAWSKYIQTACFFFSSSLLHIPSFCRTESCRSPYIWSVY